MKYFAVFVFFLIIVGFGPVYNPSKKQETFTGTTDPSGNYTVVFATPYAVTPNVQPNILGGTYLQRMITTASPTGFTINAVTQNTNTLLGIVNLVAGTTVIQGASIQVLVTEN